MEQNSRNTEAVIEVSLKWLEVISLIAGIASLVLAIIAIWLSFKFYQMSTASSDKINESSNKINNNVEKLEKMFDTMYADTFGMVKETVTHMRQQVDKSSNANEYDEELDKRINEKITLQFEDVTPETLTKEDVESIVKGLVKESVQESKEIKMEIERKNLREDILDNLKKSNEETYLSLEKKVIGSNPSKDLSTIFFDTLYQMDKKGIIENAFTDNSDGVSISNDVPIRIKYKYLDQF